jgi:aminoglycoside phosphotransferase (APT) family kinase protein
VPEAQAPLQVWKHEGGYSNETLFIDCGPHKWVLRRPPRGELLPTSHDVLREWRMISPLYQAGVRVPRPIVACEDASVIGAPFYVMERVDGWVVRDSVPPALETPQERRRISEELIDALVEIHAVDWEKAGLAGMGKPQGYLERQVRRWAGQLDLTRVYTRELPGIDEVTEWLRTHVPESGPATVVHGDYKLDNVIYAEQAPAHLLAVLDWEMATLGAPLADLGCCFPSGVLPASVGLYDLSRARRKLPRLWWLLRKRSGPVRNLPVFVRLGVWKIPSSAKDPGPAPAGRAITQDRAAGDAVLFIERMQHNRCGWAAPPDVRSQPCAPRV